MQRHILPDCGPWQPRVPGPNDARGLTARIRKQKESAGYSGFDQGVAMILMGCRWDPLMTGESEVTTTHRTAPWSGEIPDNALADHGPCRDTVIPGQWTERRLWIYPLPGWSWEKVLLASGRCRWSPAYPGRLRANQQRTRHDIWNEPGPGWEYD